MYECEHEPAHLVHFHEDDEDDHFDCDPACNDEAWTRRGCLLPE